MTNFTLYQTESVCRRQFQIYENGRKFFKWIENTVGKGEIARYEQFLLFPLCFQKTFTANLSLFGKGLTRLMLDSSQWLDKNIMLTARTRNSWKAQSCCNITAVMVEMVLILAKQHSLDSSKVKEFADKNFKFDENGRKFSKRIETVGKRRIHLLHILYL